MNIQVTNPSANSVALHPTAQDAAIAPLENIGTGAAKTNVGGAVQQAWVLGVLIARTEYTRNSDAI